MPQHRSTVLMLRFISRVWKLYLISEKWCYTQDLTLQCYITDLKYWCYTTDLRYKSYTSHLRNNVIPKICHITDLKYWCYPTDLRYESYTSYLRNNTVPRSDVEMLPYRSEVLILHSEYRSKPYTPPLCEIIFCQRHFVGYGASLQKQVWMIFWCAKEHI